MRKITVSARARLAALALAMIMAPPLSCGGDPGTNLTPIPPPVIVEPDVPPAADTRGAPGPGVWSAPTAFPDIAIHLAVLPDGNVLTWSGGEDQTDMRMRAHADIWNPVTGSHTPTPELDIDAFCSGHAFTADGVLFVTGGHIAENTGTRSGRLYTRAGTWSAIPDMNRGRWYPTNTTLPDGGMLTLAGSDENRENNLIPEVWENGSWRELSSASRALAYYPRAFVAPDGDVVITGPSPQTLRLNTNGTGAWTEGPSTLRGQDREYGSAALLDGRVILAGGGDPPTSTVEMLDLAAGAGASWAAVAPMAVARRQMNLTILADGRLLATGGTSAAGFNDAGGSVYAAEIWDPKRDRWTTVASMVTQRLYHSTAALLPDGRVISAGGGHPAATNGGADHADAEIYSPSYLFDESGRPAVRPVLTAAPDRVSYAEAFTVTSSAAASIATLTFIRLASVTHAFDQNARLVTLAFTRSGNSLHVLAPANARIAPPGHYMLFLVSATGVPSVAHIVQIH